MFRRTITVFILALATASPLAVLGLAGTGAASAEETRRTTLRFADFESAGASRTSSSAFAREFGTGDGSDDSSILDVGGRAGHVYRLGLDAGTIHGNPSGNHGVVAMVPLPREVDNACIRYRIRFGTRFRLVGGRQASGPVRCRSWRVADLPGRRR